MRTVDLFAGIGGLSLGFMEAGCEIVAACDAWEKARNVYLDNIKGHPYLLLDLSDVEAAVEAIRPFQPEVIIGGPPCQDFSSAGKRDEDGGRGDLTISFARIVAQVAPPFFVMENVPRTAKSRKQEEAERILKSAGYGLTKTIADASLHGAPQRRKRFFMVGALGGDDGAFEPFFLKRQRSSPLTIRECLGDRLNIDAYYRHPRNYSRRAVFSVDEPSPTVRGVNRPIPDGYKGHPQDAAAVDSGGVRPLTTRERALIQTFPEDFVFSGSKSEIEQMIGNAVPVKLAASVASALLIMSKNIRILESNTIYS